MTEIELDELCIALEPVPGSYAWESDPEFQGSIAVFKSPQDHRAAGNDIGVHDMAERRQFAYFLRADLGVCGEIASHAPGTSFPLDDTN